MPSFVLSTSNIFKTLNKAAPAHRSTFKQLLPSIFSLFLLCFFNSVTVGASELEQWPQTQGKALFTMKGSNTIGARLGPSLARSFLEHHGLEHVQIKAADANNEYQVVGQGKDGPVFIDIAAHGSSTGFRALLQQSADIAMSSRPIKPKEVDQLRPYGNMRQLSAEHVIAIDGIALIVHPENPIRQLSVSKIAQIFSGQISHWQEINPRYNGPINIYARDNNSGTWDTFKNLVLAKKYKLADSAKRFESNDLLSDTVAADKRGIGFVGLASLRSAKALSVSDDNTSALLPTQLSVATEDYPLARRLHLYTVPSEKSAAVTAFLDFVHGEAGQDIVERVGFVSQNPLASSNKKDRQGPAAYLSLTENAKRLSLNFRFHPHSAKLDNKARQDIKRLTGYLAQQSPEQRILLIGFGDEKQSPRRAHVLSKLRASAVKSALRTQGISSLPVAGFGAFKPVAANSNTKRIKNRRVEVWLVEDLAASYGDG